MRISARRRPGAASQRPSSGLLAHPAPGGFTLLELLVVVAIMALATAGVALALRDSSQVQLEREAQRLAALLESARAQSRASGAPVRWRPSAEGFSFEGLPAGALPRHWLGPSAVDASLPPGQAALLLGPEPVIGAQQTRLTLQGQPDRALLVASEGLRPFSVQTAP